MRVHCAPLIDLLTDYTVILMAYANYPASERDAELLREPLFALGSGSLLNGPTIGSAHHRYQSDASSGSTSIGLLSSDSPSCAPHLGGGEHSRFQSTPPELSLMVSFLFY
jgi:hypothetical protein